MQAAMSPIEESPPSSDAFTSASESGSPTVAAAEEPAADEDAAKALAARIVARACATRELHAALRAEADANRVATSVCPAIGACLGLLSPLSRSRACRGAQPAADAATAASPSAASSSEEAVSPDAMIVSPGAGSSAGSSVDSSSPGFPSPVADSPPHKIFRTTTEHDGDFALTAALEELQEDMNDQAAEEERRAHTPRTFSCEGARRGSS